MVDTKNLTEEQKKQLSKVRNKSILKGSFIGIKHGALLSFGNFVILGIALYMKLPPIFCLSAGIVNGFFVFKSWFSSLRDEESSMKQKIQKILENK